MTLVDTNYKTDTNSYLNNFPPHVYVPPLITSSHSPVSSDSVKNSCKKTTKEELKNYYTEYWNNSKNWRTEVVKGRESGRLLTYRVKSAPLNVNCDKNTLSRQQVNNHNEINTTKAKRKHLKEGESQYKSTTDETHSLSDSKKSTYSFIESVPYQSVYRLYCIQASPAFRPHVTQTFTTKSDSLSPRGSNSNRQNRKNSHTLSRSSSKATLDLSRLGVVSRAGQKEESSKSSSKSLKSRQNSSPAMLLERKNSGALDPPVALIRTNTSRTIPE